MSTTSRCTQPARNAVHAEALGRDALRRRGETRREVSGNLPTDFGFAIEVHAHEPETVYVVPIKSDSEHLPPDGKLRVYRSRTRGGRLARARPRTPRAALLCQRASRRHVLRRARSCGFYSERPGARSRLTRQWRHGRRSSRIFQRCSRSRSRPCHDNPGGPCRPSAHPRPSRDERWDSRGRRRRSPNERCWTRWKPRCVRCSEAPSEIRRARASPGVRAVLCLRG